MDWTGRIGTVCLGELRNEEVGQEWIGTFGRGVLGPGGDWQERRVKVGNGLFWTGRIGWLRSVVNGRGMAGKVLNY